MFETLLSKYKKWSFLFDMNHIFIKIKLKNSMAIFPIEYTQVKEFFSGCYAKLKFSFQDGRNPLQQ
jgi:hypothetical protein